MGNLLLSLQQDMPFRLPLLYRAELHGGWGKGLVAALRHLGAQRLGLFSVFFRPIPTLVGNISRGSQGKFTDSLLYSAFAQHRISVNLSAFIIVNGDL